MVCVTVVPLPPPRRPARELSARYNAKYQVTKRKFIKPSFNEIRHVLNLAQVTALRGKLRLLTFDGDCTLYSDGKAMNDPKLARNIVLLLKRGITCALVTAAGYGLNAAKYEHRVQMLLDLLEEHGLSAEERGRFYVLGGESASARHVIGRSTRTASARS